MRRQAFAALKAGETIVIFPAGGVSTAPVKMAIKPIARAEDLPWKNFAYRLIRSANATVLPLYFEGQNGAMFHIASKVSMAWRIALLLGEFNKRRGQPITCAWASRSNGRRSPPFRLPPRRCGSCAAGSMRCAEFLKTPSVVFTTSASVTVMRDKAQWRVWLMLRFFAYCPASHE